MKQKNILITAGRHYIALDLARQLKSCGHRIFVTETQRQHLCRSSNAVVRSYQVPSPRVNHEEFLEKLVTIVQDEKIDLLIPIFEESYYISWDLARFPKECEIFCPTFEVINSLHNKWLFHQKLVEHGIKAARASLITSQKELDDLPFHFPYALKPCYTRASTTLHKVVPPTLPSVTYLPHNPWIAQEWIEGKHFCSYAIAKKGKLQAIGVYPVRFTVDGHSCLTITNHKHPAIYQWVERFVALENFTGQISFDFIENNKGELYAIECNPRATSGLHLFSAGDRIDRAFLGGNEEMITPTRRGGRQITLGMLMYGWRSHNRNSALPPFWKEMWANEDVIFSWNDPKPLCTLPFFFPYYWLQSKKLGLAMPASFIYDTDWDGHPMTAKRNS